MNDKKIKSTIASNIKKYRNLHNFTQKELADKLGVSHNTISSWEKGTNSIYVDTLYEICSLFKVELNDMYNSSENNIEKVDTNNTLIPRTKQIPIVGSVACGNPIYAEENIQEYVTVLESDNVDFALYADGDSMNNCKIDDGDTVYIRKQSVVNNGEIAVVLVDNDSATVKRFYDYGDQIVLRPDSTNPKHDEQRYFKKDHNIIIQGKVIFIKTYVK